MMILKKTQKTPTTSESQNGMFWHRLSFSSPTPSKTAAQKSIHFQEVFGLWWRENEYICFTKVSPAHLIHTMVQFSPWTSKTHLMQ